MPIPDSASELAELFRRLDAPDADAWASSQVEMQEIGCLHESVLETDPTGREMRPLNPKD